MSKVIDQKSNTQKLYHNFFALASKTQHFTTWLPHDQVVLNWAALLQRDWENLATLYLPSKNKIVKKALIKLCGKLQSSKNDLKIKFLRKKYLILISPKKIQLLFSQLFSMGTFFPSKFRKTVFTSQQDHRLQCAPVEDLCKYFSRWALVTN